MLKLYVLLIYNNLTKRIGKTFITFLGVSFATAALVNLESIMEGVSKAMIRNSISIHHGHILINDIENETYEKLINHLKRMQTIRQIIVRKKTEVIVQNKANIKAMTLYGIESQKEKKATFIHQKIVAGTYNLKTNEILLGKDAAKEIGIKNIGESVTIEQGNDKLILSVTGIFETKIPYLDERYAYTSLDSLQTRNREIALFLEDDRYTDEVAGNISERWKDKINLNTWKNSMAEIRELIDLNNVSMNIMLGLVLLIMAFGLSNTVIISVKDRTKEFAVLRSLGMTPSQIVCLVVLEISFMMIFASCFGLLFGMAILSIWGNFGLDLSRWTAQNPHFIASGIIYPHVSLRTVFYPFAVCLGCGFLAALYPSKIVGKLKIHEALKYS